MNAEYKRDLQNNYLILESPEDGEDSYCLRMAETNEIAGLLSFHSARKDGRLYLHYEITSRQPLQSIYEKRLMRSQDILMLLSGIRDTLDELQKYLLNADQLVFDPQFIYLNPERNKVLLCYLPGVREYPITVLAEFILKRLDHEDRQAVVLGYSFYQRSTEENFSLRQTIRDVLASGQRGMQEPLNGVRMPQELPGADAGFREQMEGMCADERSGQVREAGNCGGKSKNGPGNGKAEDRSIGDLYGYKRGPENRRIEGRPLSDKKEPGSRRTESESSGNSHRYEKELGGREIERSLSDALSGPGRSESEDSMEWQVEDKENPYHVIHKERKKKSRVKGTVDWLFERIHPAVLISALFLTVALEAVFYLGVIELAEAGGIFFLMISVETLVNKYWRHKKEEQQKTEQWWEEEENEEYSELREEMYAKQPQEEPAEETRCLVPDSKATGIRLICIPDRSGNAFPDIYVSRTPQYIGKQRGESDVLLDVATVSRVHAQVEQGDEGYYVRDLNSKNGTFVNGERLRPQERRAFVPGDRITFAEVEYQAVETGQRFEQSAFS